MGNTLVGAGTATDTPTEPDDAVEPDDAAVPEVDDTGGDDTKVDDTEPDDSTTAERPVRRLAAVVAVLAAVAAVAFGGYQIWQNHRLDARDALRAEYIATAKDGVLRLTTIRSASADADVKHLLAITSGDFRTQFSSRTESYSKVVKEAAVTSTGTIVSVGVERFDDSSATLLVAAHSEITNKGTTEPESRDYRFRVVVSNGDPQTISKVDFVL